MIWLLPVTWDDSADLLRWRNDPVTRANSRATQEVNSVDHYAWMVAYMTPGRPHGEAWIADVDGTSVGVVRVNPACEVSITVAPEHRGKGYSKQMLKQVCEKMKHGDLYAEIRQSNAASRYIFELAGFKLIDESDEFRYYQRGPA